MHYQSLKHLPLPRLIILLNIINQIWDSGTFPSSWRNATVIPIPKLGKDDTDPSNYQPISLTSCICKTMELMVNLRLMWYLEVNNILTETQSGFHLQRSTIDQLVRLESIVRQALIRRQRVVAIFFILKRLMIPHGNMA